MRPTKKPSRPNKEHELKARIVTLEKELRLTKMALDKAKLHLSLIRPPPGVVQTMDGWMIFVLKGPGAVSEEALFVDAEYRRKRERADQITAPAAGNPRRVWVDR